MPAHALVADVNHAASDVPPVPADLLGPDLPPDHPVRVAWLTLFRVFTADAEALSPRAFRAARAATLLLLSRKLEARLLDALDHPDQSVPAAAILSQVIRLGNQAAEILETLNDRLDHSPVMSPAMSSPHPVPATERSLFPEAHDRSSIQKKPDVSPVASGTADGPRQPETETTPPTPAACCFDEPPDDVENDPEYRLRVAWAEREALLLPPRTRPTAEGLIREAARRVLAYDLPPPGTRGKSLETGNFRRASEKFGKR